MDVSGRADATFPDPTLAEERERSISELNQPECPSLEDGEDVAGRRRRRIEKHREEQHCNEDKDCCYTTGDATSYGSRV